MSKDAYAKANLVIIWAALTVSVPVMGSLSCNLKDLFTAKADVKSQVDAALLRYERKMENQVGNAGRDINMTESLTSILLALGAVLLPMIGLLLYYRSKMNGADAVSSKLIRSIEFNRDKARCSCGEPACLDCMVTRLNADTTAEGRLLREMVARVTRGSKKEWSCR